MADGVISPAGGVSTGVMILLVMFSCGTARSALPPASDTSTPSVPSTSSGAAASTEGGQGIKWFLPPVRIGGTLSYSLRRDSFDEQDTQQAGLTATLNASTNTFIWQPWFAQVNGGLGFTTTGSGSENNGVVASSKNVSVTGNGQLLLLPFSKFPFEAFFQRNDSRVASDMALANGFASQRYGFTQRYFRPEGEVMFGWDRNEQAGHETGLDLQDNLQLRLAHRLENHRFQFSGDRTTNWREITDERAQQDSFSVQHSFSPISTISVENLVNISRSDYRLQQGGSDTRLLQFSSNAFWRPEEQPMTLTAGLRVFALGTDATGLGANGFPTENRVFNANGNFGLSYEFNRFTRLSAGLNINMVENNGVKTTSATANESLVATYQPEPMLLGDFRYLWGVSASLSNQQTATEDSAQLALQFTHSLNRIMKLEGDASITIEGSQTVSTSASNANQRSDVSSSQLTHTGSVSWDLRQKAGTALLRLSVNDSRALDGNQEFFQLINFQASSNLPISGYSSWTGNLTMQAVRQGRSSEFGGAGSDSGYVTSSGGSISYQNGRFFGFRRLRFVSDFRLNSQSLLPLLGSGADQDVAVWDNRLNYAIGRTQLQASMQISSTGSQKRNVDPVTKVENIENVRKLNKSIMFSVTRSFGNF